MKRLLFEQLLREFNNDDREDVMRFGDDFGVSYEIELESEGSLCGDDGEERQEARERRAHDRLDYDHFYEEASQRESDQFFDYNLETGEDVMELVAWFIKEDPMDNGFAEPGDQEMRMVNQVINSIGYNNGDRGFREVVARILNDDSKAAIFFAAMRENEHIISHLRKVWDFDHEMKSKKTQRTFGDFDGEMGDEVEYVAGLESLDLKGRLTLFNHYVFNFEDTIGENFPVGSDTGGFGPATLDMFDLFEAWDLEASWETLYEQGTSDIDDVFFSRYSDNATIANLAERDYKGVFLPSMVEAISSMVGKMIEESAQDQLDEFQRDPLYYLEQEMGWDSWDDDHQRWHDDDDYSTDKESMLWEHLPNFMSKYANNLKIEDDCSLTNGLEFSMDNPQYLSGLDDAFEFLDILFEDIDNQENFRFDDDTGLHINISYLGENGNPLGREDYNFMKSLLFLNHKFATKDFGKRQHSTWAGDLKGRVIDSVAGMLRADETLDDKIKARLGKDKSNKQSIMYYLLKKRFSDINSLLSTAVIEKAAQIGGKSIGFNVSHFAYGQDRVEFRYPGGEKVTALSIEEATLKYAYLILLAANPEFKKREYQAKLVGLLNNLNFASTEKAKGLTWVKKIKKGTIFTDYSKRRRGDTINWSNLINYSIPQKVLAGHRHRGDASYNFATDNDYVMFKKLDLKKKRADFAYIVDKPGGSRESHAGHPQNGLYIDEFSIPLKNFELDLQDGTMAPLGMGPKWSFTPGDEVSWDSFKRNASGDHTALTRAKRKFIQQVFAAVQKYPGEILIKDLTKVDENEYERRQRVNSIDRAVSAIHASMETIAGKKLSDKEVLKRARKMSHWSGAKIKKWIDQISDQISKGKREHPTGNIVSSRYLYGDDWEVFRKFQGKDHTDVEIVSPTHKNIRNFMDKMNISTQEMHDIEQKNVEKLADKVLSAF